MRVNHLSAFQFIVMHVILLLPHSEECANIVRTFHYLTKIYTHFTEHIFSIICGPKSVVSTVYLGDWK